MYLSCDSSPQGGLDFLVGLEDRVGRKSVSQIVDANTTKLSAWSLASHCDTTPLPLSILGSGGTDSAAKFESLLHAICLDCGEQHMEVYSRSVVSICSDYGTEAHLTKVPGVSLNRTIVRLFVFFGFVELTVGQRSVVSDFTTGPTKGWQVLSESRSSRATE